jgi:hypothetical protein
MQNSAETENFIDTEARKQLEAAWSVIFGLVNGFLSVHKKFGFELVAKHSNPSLEDLLLSLKTMNVIMDTLDSLGRFEGSEQRKLLNAKQQIVWFELAVISLKAGDKTEYLELVNRMDKQVQF